MKLEVEFGPDSNIALVWEGPTTVWRVSPKEETRREGAPQLLNLRHFDSRYAAVDDFDDEHPFPKVLAELKRRIAQS